MNIGIRLHDTAHGTLEERLAFARAQGFSCAHTALSKVLDDFSMQEAPEKICTFASSPTMSFARPQSGSPTPTPEFFIAQARPTGSPFLTASS